MTTEEAVNTSDYPYLMPWDRRSAAVRAFVAIHEREPATASDLDWIRGYIACIEDLKP